MTNRAGPFIHSGQTNRKLMVMVLVCLSPCVFAAVLRHGGAAGLAFACAAGGAWSLELLLDRPRASDCSALVTGVLIALLLPASGPWWLALAGGALAIGVGKHLFGGFGHNPFNPAAVARVLLMGTLPASLFATAWPADGVSMATPLAKESGALAPDLAALLAGNVPGALGQAAPLATLIGGLLLVILRAVDWRVPLTYLAAVSFLALVLPGTDRIEGHAPWLLGNPLLHLLGGGTLLGAFFLLTDPVTAPFTPGGRILFALAAALATMLIRHYTPYPDGVALGVVVANATVPLIDRATLGLKSGDPHPLAGRSRHPTLDR